MSVYVPDPALNDWVPLWNLGNNVPAVQPSCRVKKSAVQSVVNAAGAILTWDLEDYDTDNIHDLVTNTSRLTCRTTGKYLVSLTVCFAGNATGTRAAYVLKNGAVALDGPIYHAAPNPVASETTSVTATGLMYLQAGDYIEAAAYHTSGAALNVVTGDSATGNGTGFSMALVGGMQGPAGPGTPTYGTTFPVNPLDGQEHILVDSLTASTYQWRFRYNANASSAYKWEFIGGPPILTIGGSVVCTSTSVVAMTGAPTTTVPRTGIYNEELSASVGNNGVASGGYTGYGRALHSVSGAVDVGLAMAAAAWAAGSTYLARTGVVLNAGETITWQAYLNSAVSTTVSSGRVTLTPVRVS